MINKTLKFVNEVRPHMPNIFWSNLNQIVTTGCGLVGSVIFARFAKKELYGQYLFVLAIFGLFSIISIPGVRAVIFKAIAQGHDDVYSKATAFSFLWSLLGIPTLVAAGIFIYLFKTKILGASLIGCAVFFPFMTSLQTWMVFLKGRSNFSQLTVYTSIQLLTNLLAVTMAIIFTRNLILILLAYFLTNAGFNIFYHFKVANSPRNNELASGWKRQSYALTIMELSTIIFGRVDTILIGTLLPIDQVAIYGLVMKSVDVLFEIIRSTMEGIAPNLFQSKKITIRYFYKFFLLSFLIPLVLYPIIKYPILFLYSREYSEVINLSKVYLAAIPFYFLNLVATYFMIKYELNKEINISRIVSLIAVVLLYIILIPLYGIWGGVISSILYFVIQLFLNLFLLKIKKVG